MLLSWGLWVAPLGSLLPVVLRGLPGGLGLVRGRALEALGRDGSLVGHALPHDVPFPPQHHLLQGHSQGLSGLVRPSAETFCLPHPALQAEPGLVFHPRPGHAWWCSLPEIWVWAHRGHPQHLCPSATDKVKHRSSTTEQKKKK